MKLEKQKLRILHLEDVKSDADQVHRILRKSNIEFEVMLVDTKEEFTNAIISYNPDLIISDHSLPRFNSIEAMEVVKQSGISIPFILVTGAVSEEFAAMAIKEGADDYVLKDRLQRLPAAINNTLLAHKLAKEQKRIARQMRNIYRYSQDMICSLDEKGVFLFVSHAVQTILGYRPEEIIGKPYTDFIYPEDIDATLKAAQAVLTGIPNSSFENRYVHKNGNLVPLIWSSRYEEKEKTIFSIAQDATEQIQARQKIEESRKQYEHLLKHFPAAVYTCDASGKILLYNKAASELWGREPNLEKDRWSGCYKIYDDEGNRLDFDSYPLNRSIKERREIHGEEVVTERPDGTKRNVIQFPTPQYDKNGKVVGGINVLMDITDRKKIEEDNKKLAMIASGTHNAVVVTDVEEKITWVNEGFEKITGYTMAEAVGKKPGALLQGAYTNPDTIKFMHDCIQKQIRFRTEVLNYSKSGSEYWLDIEVTPMRDKNGKLTGFMAIQQDITERKNTEKETQKLVRRLQSINKDLRQFSNIVSHNLRGPIARILGLSALYSKDPKNSEFITERIEEETKNLDKVFHEFNAIISARDAGIENIENVNFKNELHDVMQTLQHEIKMSKAVLTSNFGIVGNIFSVKPYVQSILYNLISNALKYTSSEVIPKIHVSTAEDNEYIYLTVEDNGLGINLDVHGDNIFGLYQRFHGLKYPGKGIGLNIVKAHAESLGGYVKVYSKPDNGSRFTVCFSKTLAHVIENKAAKALANDWSKLSGQTLSRENS